VRIRTEKIHVQLVPHGQKSVLPGENAVFCVNQAGKAQYQGKQAQKKHRQ